MRPPDHDTALPFVMVACPSCARKVLPWTDLADDGSLVQRCLHCDTPVEATERELLLRLSWAELEALGFQEVPPARVRSGVCGTDGGCGSSCGAKRDVPDPQNR